VTERQLAAMETHHTPIRDGLDEGLCLACRRQYPCHAAQAFAEIRRLWRRATPDTTD
jgi:hypothetical protein